MKPNGFAGTRTLFKLFLRRDQFLLPLWIFLPVVLGMIVAATFIAMADQGMHSVLNEFDKDPLVSAILGPVMSFDLPGAIVWRGTSQLALVLAIASLLTVIRHTRTDEETGRSELIRAYAVGPYASLTAALILTIVGNLVSGVLIALSVIALGGDAAGSFVFGATMSVVGCFFAGIGALGVQLRENSGSARGIGMAVAGLGIMMMILNNVGGGDTVLKWISPMAWQRVTRPFAGNHGWSLLCFTAIAAVPIIISYALSIRRDLGAGILPSRPGPSAAALGFSSPLALAWRLHQRSFIGWLMGTVLYIVGFSALSPGLSQSGGISGWLSGLGGTDWTDQAGLGCVFISIGIYLVSLVVAVYAITAVLRMKKEEDEGRTELLVDKQVSRISWMSSHLIVAASCSAGLLLAMGVAGGLVYGFVTDDLSNGFWNIFYMNVSKIPPVWILLSLTAFLYGLWPRITSLCWVVWLAFVLLELGWEAQLVDWSLMQISPFSFAHYTIDISNLPMLPLLCLFFVSALLTGIGLLGFRSRDILTKA
ncbi:MAG: ABC transporter permease [Bacillota bacterium]